jgi:hypothetical protein
MITKREQARYAYKNGNYKKAFYLGRKFDKIFNKSEIRTLEISYECMTNKNNFYDSLGINTENEIEKAKIFFLKLWK